MTKTPDTLLVRDADGRVTTIPGNTDDEILTQRGWTVVDDENAVDRPRRRRTKADTQRLIKDGVIADPETGIPERVRSDNEHVVDVETARADAKRE